MTLEEFIDSVRPIADHGKMVLIKRAWAEATAEALGQNTCLCVSTRTYENGACCNCGRKEGQA